jgi:hypothetical protein
MPDAARIVIIAEILFQNSSEMFFGNYNHVVETLAANTADHSFRIGVLPGRVRSCDHFFDPQSCYPPPKIVSVD